MSKPENKPGTPEFARETTKQTFRDKLKLQEADFLMDLKAVRNEQIAPSAANLPRALGMKGAVERRFMNEAKLIREETLRIAQAEEMTGEPVNYHEILKQHAIKMRALVNRQSLYLEVIGGEKVSTAKEAILVLSTIDDITMEQMNFLKKLMEAKRTGEIAASDLEFIAGELREHFMVRNGGSSIGMLMLTNLRPEHRMRLVRQMWTSPKQNPESMPHFINDLVAGEYLLTDQAQQLVREQIDALKAKREVVKGRKNKKAIDAEIGTLEKEFAFVDSDKMHVIQERARAEVKSQEKTMTNRQYGHKNHVKKLFSVEGIIGGLAFANGALTVVGNALVAFPNPVDFIANPCTIFGLGLMGAGDIMTDSFAGLMPGRKEAWAAATRDNDEVETERTKANIDRMYRTVGNNPVQTEFYYRYADLIVEAYKKKIKEGTPLGDIKITIEDLGKKYDDLPAPFRKKTQANLEEMMTRMVRGFMEDYAGLNIEQAIYQKEWIDKCRKARDVKTIAGVSKDIPQKNPAK